MTTFVTVEQPVIKAVSLDLIDIPDEYQRQFTPARATKMAKDFDPAICGTLLVNRRGDRYVVVDGQHRLAALRLLGYAVWPCVVTDAESVEDEARQFTETNTSQKRLKAWAIFRARLVAKDPVAVDIQSICDSLGITIAEGSSAPAGRRTRAVVAMEKVYQMGGPNHLANVIRMAVSSWPGDGRNLDQDVLLGMSSFLIYYQDDQNFNRARAIEKFSRLPLVEVRQRSRVLGPSGGSKMGVQSTFGLAPGMVKALVEAYNWRLRSNELSEPTLSGWKKINLRRSAK